MRVKQSVGTLLVLSCYFTLTPVLFYFALVHPMYVPRAHGARTKIPNFDLTKGYFWSSLG